MLFKNSHFLHTEQAKKYHRGKKLEYIMNQTAKTRLSAKFTMNE